MSWLRAWWRWRLARVKRRQSIAERAINIEPGGAFRIPNYGGRRYRRVARLRQRGRILQAKLDGVES